MIRYDLEVGHTIVVAHSRKILSIREIVGRILKNGRHDSSNQNSGGEDSCQNLLSCTKSSKSGEHFYEASLFACHKSAFKSTEILSYFLIFSLPFSFWDSVQLKFLPIRSTYFSSPFRHAILDVLLSEIEFSIFEIASDVLQRSTYFPNTRAETHNLSTNAQKQTTTVP